MTIKDEITTLVFDWGDTLMQVYPQYKGAMVDWPEVAAIEGAKQALSDAHQRYRILVATNAVNSSAAQVRAALVRAGLAQEIDQIYTYHELGSRKPEPAFFYALEQAAGQPAGKMVMIGDDYKVDVAGAWAAGWRTVWFNPDRKAAPGLLPLQKAEIHHLSDLPSGLERLDLPDTNLCLSWMVQAGTAANLLVHVQVVGAITYQKALWLSQAGVSIDPLLAHRGGLLHDLAKINPNPLEKNERDHALRAADLLLSYQQPKLAEIARRHVLDSVLDPERKPLTAEQKVVYIADKLTEGGRVVGLEERLTALIGRYPQSAGKIQAAAPAALALQSEYCQKMGFPDQELASRLSAALMGK